MNKINKNKAVLGLKILSILAFGVLLMPVRASAVFITNGNNLNDNPIPSITSFSPDTINSNDNRANIIIAIAGYGFIPSSIARINGSSRPTTFIDYSHVLIKLYPNDVYNTDGFYVNIFNVLPGGGYSNSAFITVNNREAVPYSNNPSSTITKNSTETEKNITNNYTSSNTTRTENVTNSNTNTRVNDDTNNNSSNLASTAILGAPDSFLPSGLVQWVIFAIIILFIIILVRRVFGAKKIYDETPMKHA